MNCVPPPGTFALLNITQKCAFLRRQASNFKKFARMLSKHIQVKLKISDCLIFLSSSIIIVLCNHAYIRQKNGYILQEQKNGRDKSSGVFLCLFKDVFGFKTTTIWLVQLLVQTLDLTPLCLIMTYGPAFQIFLSSQHHKKYQELLITKLFAEPRNLLNRPERSNCLNKVF